MRAKAGSPKSGLIAAALTAAFIWTAPGLARAQDSATSGRLVLNGSSTPLSHAYATAEPGAFDKTKEDIRILLSDVPLTPEARDDVFGLIRLGRDGSAHIVEVVLDAGGSPISGAIYAQQFDGMVSLAGMHVFERRRFDRDGVAGRLHMRAPSEFAEVTFDYDAEFSAAIPRPPTPQQLAAALASPEARAATAYLNALRSGNLSAFLGTLTAQGAREYAGADGAARFRQLRTEMPRDTKVTAVTNRSTTSAVVVVQGHQQGIIIQYDLHVEPDGGTWKVSN